MKKPDKFVTVPISELIPYEKNARKHSDEQIKKIQASLREFGFVNPVLIDANYGIISGHGRVEAAKREKITEVPCVMVEHLTEAQKKAYILADNRLAELASWDMDIVKEELEGLKVLDFDTELTGFDFMEDAAETENPYTGKTAIPQYEVTGEIPRLDELVESMKVGELEQEIDSAPIDEDEKTFLKIAAARHYAFNFRKIAEYYANVASPDMQRLMEKSALVIIDIDDAIANGYVRLAGDIADMLKEDEDDEG